MQIPRSFRRSLKRLGPYQSLLVLAVPLAIVEPLKLIAVYSVGEGHFVAGTFLMICAYGSSDHRSNRTPFSFPLRGAFLRAAYRSLSMNR